jgi:ubiquinone/menaquinone biosynthesis C-methylase UbiE
MSSSGTSILDARSKAQHLAFGPIVFQAVRLLWKTGVLKAIERAEEPGVTIAQLVEQTGISPYAASVLCDMAVSAGVIDESQSRFTATKLGSIILHDKLTQVNMDFVHDVCYQGMFFLEEAVRSGTPAGLKVLSQSKTLYECLTEIPEAAQRSWYDFNHYYSDSAFAEAAKIVFARPVHLLLDVGGNTGRWALRSLEASDTVHITIVDLPGQLDRAKVTLKQTPHACRVAYYETNLLAESALLPFGFDVVWMSQFLDCFSEDQIVQILRKVRLALTAEGRVFIMETLVDRQRFHAATYSLNATSLYFTAMANGNSRMYHSTVLQRLIIESGFRIVASYDDLGLGHTLLECQAA